MQCFVGVHPLVPWGPPLVPCGPPLLPWGPPLMVETATHTLHCHSLLIDTTPGMVAPVGASEASAGACPTPSSQSQPGDRLAGSFGEGRGVIALLSYEHWQLRFLLWVEPPKPTHHRTSNRTPIGAAHPTVPQ